MGKIFVLMGKSASGKDAIFKRLLARGEPPLNRIIPYTTRPIRQKEVDGVEYHFCDEARERELDDAGRIIEKRIYHTVHGRWAYFTVDDGQVDLTRGDYLVIGTLVSYEKLADYYKKENIIPIYIETEDSIRLERAIKRERKQAEPKYEEMCRRFLADAQDFAPERLAAAGIETIFRNEGGLEDIVEQVAAFIRSCTAM